MKFWPRTYLDTIFCESGARGLEGWPARNRSRLDPVKVILCPYVFQVAEPELMLNSKGFLLENCVSIDLYRIPLAQIIFRHDVLRAQGELHEKMAHTEQIQA